jgi:hypothetical protein
VCKPMPRLWSSVSIDIVTFSLRIYVLRTGNVSKYGICMKFGSNTGSCWEKESHASL